MDKKKVKDYLAKAQNALLRYDKAGDKSAFTRAFNLIQDASLELYKSDWISVEDELPPYEEMVNVRMEDVAGITYTCSSRCPVYNKMKRFNYDENSFGILYSIQHVTHWKPIEKLEE